jgi:large subunit ribosomal protein L23
MADLATHYQLIKKPLMTEKSTTLQDLRNQFSFLVPAGANKSEIKKAIEALFKVSVTKVNTINQPGKIKRILGRPSRTSGWKKAIVTLVRGDTIEFT